MKEGKNLVIVESPGKIKKIQSALGDGYIVKASIGHIRDLDESGLSIDIENGFKPEYVVPADKKKVVADLKRKQRPRLPYGWRPMPTGKERPYHGTFMRLSDSAVKTPRESYSRK